MFRGCCQRRAPPERAVLPAAGGSRRETGGSLIADEGSAQDLQGVKVNSEPEERPWYGPGSRPTQPVRPEPSSTVPPKRKTVTLTKADPSDKLGVDVFHNLQIKYINEGLVQSHNQHSDEDNQVSIGDVIVEVNGISEDIQAMMKAITEELMLTLLLEKRPLPRHHDSAALRERREELLRKVAAEKAAPTKEAEDDKAADTQDPVELSSHSSLNSREPSRHGMSSDEWEFDQEEAGQKEAVSAPRTEEPPSRAPDVAVKAVMHIPITVTKREEVKSLGVDVKIGEKAELEVKIIREGDGLVSEWNAANPDSQVMVGDRIVEVNGNRGHGKELVDCMGKSEKLEILFERYVPNS